MSNYVPIKHKQMSFVSNGGKFNLYTVLNGLIFPTPTQPRISFERAILTSNSNSPFYREVCVNWKYLFKTNDSLSFCLLLCSHISGVHLNLPSKLELKSKNTNNAKGEVSFKQLIRDL
jgi:hypothetical protein